MIVVDLVAELGCYWWAALSRGRVIFIECETFIDFYSV